MQRLGKKEPFPLQTQWFEIITVWQARVNGATISIAVSILGDCVGECISKHHVSPAASLSDDLFPSDTLSSEVSCHTTEYESCWFPIN